MRILYATKTDRNGNTYKLVIDTDRKQYARECAGFFHRSDAITVSKATIRGQIDLIKKNGFKEVDCL